MSCGRGLAIGLRAGSGEHLVGPHAGQGDHRVGHLFEGLQALGEGDVDLLALGAQLSSVCSRSALAASSLLGIPRPGTRRG